MVIEEPGEALAAHGEAHVAAVLDCHPGQRRAHVDDPRPEAFAGLRRPFCAKAIVD
jgi:hypothetical protein